MRGGQQSVGRHAVLSRQERRVGWPTKKLDVRIQRAFRKRLGHTAVDLHDMRQAHRLLKQSVPAFLRDANLLSLFTTPIIYSLALPLLLLDLWVTVYQWTCFPVYGMARVPRGRYFVVDRHRLAYLNVIEKVHCTYCSYATGLLAYVREVTARTEQYWCPIKHARPIPTPHSRYHLFFAHDDAVGYRHHLAALRETLRAEHRRQPAKNSRGSGNAARQRCAECERTRGRGLARKKVSCSS